MLAKINKFMFDLPVVWFILLILLGSFLFAMPLDLFLPEIEKNPIMEQPIIIEILAGIVAAPIFETIVFQVFIFWILSFIPFLRDYDFLVIFIAAIIFGLNHSFGITYIVATTIIGLFYNYAYWVYHKKNEKNQVTISAFWVVCWIHFLHNSIAFIGTHL
ncbi:CPBP family glutamic-type intramembrane protease [Bacillus cereus]|uniref:CPBP family glutamic-type intramembrane protease n=1 Tax=Bacillus cereus TaxID=1396 RepID=UPI0024BD3A5A|nr:CPBP family glutamic-type intramembrane protease [Bacillus cereus]WHT87115.1 CPBP family glutamic-type intramembrane protease [Bacillus cereus]